MCGLQMLHMGMRVARKFDIYESLATDSDYGEESMIQGDSQKESSDITLNPVGRSFGIHLGEESTSIDLESSKHQPF